MLHRFLQVYALLCNTAFMLPRKESLRLADETLRECCERMSLPSKRFTKEARTWIRQRKWTDPNRLRRCVYFAALTSRGDVVDRGHFPLKFPRDHEAFSNAQMNDIGLAELVRQKFSHFLNRVGDQEIEGVYNYVMRQVERSIFELAWNRSGTSQAKMSRMLGMHRNTVRRKLKELGIK